MENNIHTHKKLFCFPLFNKSHVALFHVSQILAREYNHTTNLLKLTTKAEVHHRLPVKQEFEKFIVL